MTAFNKLSKHQEFMKPLESPFLVKEYKVVDTGIHQIHDKKVQIFDIIHIKSGERVESVIKDGDSNIFITKSIPEEFLKHNYNTACLEGLEPDIYIRNADININRDDSWGSSLFSSFLPNSINPYNTSLFTIVPSTANDKGIFSDDGSNNMHGSSELIS